MTFWRIRLCVLNQKILTQKQPGFSPITIYRNLRKEYYGKVELNHIMGSTSEGYSHEPSFLTEYSFNMRNYFRN